MSFADWPTPRRTRHYWPSDTTSTVANGENDVADKPEKPMTETKPETLYERIRKNDESAVPEFREFLRKNPKVVDHYAHKSEELLLKNLSGEDGKAGELMFREALTANLESLRAELAGAQPSAIERLLVERVVACWLQVYEADLATGLSGGAIAVQQAVYNLSRQDRAHRRFLSAVKTLATVRRLALPTLVAISVTGTVEKTEAEPALMSRPWRLGDGDSEFAPVGLWGGSCRAIPQMRIDGVENTMSESPPRRGPSWPVEPEISAEPKQRRDSR